MGFEIVHSMKEKKEQCEACGAYALRRLPSIPNYIKKINKDPNKKVGTVVEEYIRKNKDVLPWKDFNKNMAVSVEYNLEY